MTVPPAGTGDTQGSTPTVPAPSTTAGSNLPPGLRSELDRLIEVTQEVRGLQFIEPPKIVVVTDAELERRVREDLAEELDDIEIDQAVFELLGLLEEDRDLERLYLDLYGEQVAGFYDGDTREMVVPVGDGDLTALQRSTIVHELTHALTDQHFGMWKDYRALVDAERFDEAAAMLAVVEGDAVLAEVLYAQRLDTDEREDLLEGSLDVDTSAFDAAPRFIRDSLVFPYTDGFEYVLQVYLDEGHDGVNRLYDEAPASTEEILAPGSNLPAEISVPNLTIEGYQVDSDGSWGALSWKLMFDQVLGGAPSAVDGWGGDRAFVHTDGANVVLSIVYGGDAASDVSEMQGALEDYFVVVSGSPTVSSGVLEFDDGRVRIATRTDGSLVLVAGNDAAAAGAALDVLLGI